MNYKNKYYLCRLIINTKSIMEMHNKEIIKYAIRWAVIAYVFLFILYISYIHFIH